MRWTFPPTELREVPVTRQMADALGAAPLAAYMGRDLMCVLESETDVKKLSPDLEKAKDLPGLLLHATAPGSETDCVSRTFAPKCGVPGGPGLRVRALPHCPLLDRPPAKAAHYGLSGFCAGRYPLLRGGRRPGQAQRESGAVCRIGNLPRLTGRFCGWFWAGSATSSGPARRLVLSRFSSRLFTAGRVFRFFRMFCAPAEPTYISPAQVPGNPKRGRGEEWSGRRALAVEQRRPLNRRQNTRRIHRRFLPRIRFFGANL